jgi:hypothetical protein
MQPATTLEYFLLQYAPNPLREDRCVNVGIVLFDYRIAPDGFFGVRFRQSWERHVKTVNPDADMEMLLALVHDIELKLAEPNLRPEMIALMEGSFSNTLRVTERKRWSLQDPEVAMKALALLHFD